MSFEPGRPSANVGPDRLESTITVSEPADRLDPSLERLEADTLSEMAAAWREGLSPPAEKWLERQSLMYSEFGMRRAISAD